MRPHAVAVDGVETLVSLEGVAVSLDAAGVRGQPLERFFARLLRDGFALGVEPDRLALVAAHGWDAHGARRAGLVGAWVSRLEGTFAATFDPPDETGADLVEVADRLLALPKGA
jgi:hypothetical protein